MPPRGFEPLISALKGRRPRPLDDGGSGRCVGRGTLGRDGARKGYQIERKACRVESRHTTKRPRLSSRPSLGSGSWIRTNDLRVMSPTSYHCSIPRCNGEYTPHVAEESSARGPGTGLLSRAAARRVSSALGRFTTVFGKGTGGSTPPAPPRPRPLAARVVLFGVTRGDPGGPGSCPRRGS